MVIPSLGGAVIGARRCRWSRRAPATAGAPRRCQHGEQPAPRQPPAAGGNDQPGTKVVIGFSAPAADHGWIAAIAKNAEAAGQAVLRRRRSSRSSRPNDINQQISAVESLIAAKVERAGDPAQRRRSSSTRSRSRPCDAGIPVINLDRIFPDKLAYRTWIGGDNYGMGVAAGHYIGEQLKDKGVTEPGDRGDPGHRRRCR